MQFPKRARMGAFCFVNCKTSFYNWNLRGRVCALARTYGVFFGGKATEKTDLILFGFLQSKKYYMQELVPKKLHHHN